MDASRTGARRAMLAAWPSVMIASSVIHPPHVPVPAAHTTCPFNPPGSEEVHIDIRYPGHEPKIEAVPAPQSAVNAVYGEDVGSPLLLALQTPGDDERRG